MFYNFGVMIPSPVFLEYYHINNKTIYYLSILTEHLAYFIVYLASLKKYNAASRRNFWK